MDDFSLLPHWVVCIWWLTQQSNILILYTVIKLKASKAMWAAERSLGVYNGEAWCVDV